VFWAKGTVGETLFCSTEGGKGDDRGRFGKQWGKQGPVNKGGCASSGEKKTKLKQRGLKG